MNSNSEQAQEQNTSNPFDPARLRLSQHFGATGGVKKITTLVPSRRPNKQEFFRVRPGEEWRLDTLVYEDQIDRETYLVSPNLAEELSGEVRPVCLRSVITRQENLILWPCKLPTADGRSNSWNESALQAASLAEERWVRITANNSANMYDVVEPIATIPDPVWPDVTFQQMLELAFKDRFVDSPDHPVLKKLRGEV